MTGLPWMGVRPEEANQLLLAGLPFRPLVHLWVS